MKTQENTTLNHENIKQAYDAKQAERRITQAANDLYGDLVTWHFYKEAGDEDAAENKTRKIQRSAENLYDEVTEQQKQLTKTQKTKKQVVEDARWFLQTTVGLSNLINAAQKARHKKKKDKEDGAAFLKKEAQKAQERLDDASKDDLKKEARKRTQRIIKDARKKQEREDASAT